MYDARMSPILHGSSVIRCFKQVIRIRNGMIFDFYTGLPHTYSNVSFSSSFSSPLSPSSSPKVKFFPAINSDSYDCPLYVCCVYTCTCVVAPLSLQMATNSQECYASQQFLIVDMLFHACLPKNKTLWLAKCPRCQRKMITGHTQGKQQCSLSSFSA